MHVFLRTEKATHTRTTLCVPSTSVVSHWQWGHCDRPGNNDVGNAVEGGTPCCDAATQRHGASVSPQTGAHASRIRTTARMQRTRGVPGSDVSGGGWVIRCSAFPCQVRGQLLLCRQKERLRGCWIVLGSFESPTLQIGTAGDGQACTGHGNGHAPFPFYRSCLVRYGGCSGFSPTIWQFAAPTSPSPPPPLICKTRDVNARCMRDACEMNTRCARCEYKMHAR